MLQYFKPKKENLLLTIPENIGDRVLSVCKTEITIEYRKNGVWRIKNFKCINFFNWLSILQHISFDEYNNFWRFNLTILVELFRPDKDICWGIRH